MFCVAKYKNHIYANASRNILIPITTEECRCGLHRQLKGLFFLWFPFCRGEGSLVVTPLYGYFFPLVPVVGIFSPFSSSSGFLRSLFTQSSHLKHLNIFVYKKKFKVVEFRCVNDNTIIGNHINTSVCRILQYKTDLICNNCFILDLHTFF